MDFLFDAFRHKDDAGKDIHLKQAYTYTDHTLTDIISSWFASPHGCLDEESVLMYLVTTHCTDIKPIWTCRADC